MKRIYLFALVIIFTCLSIKKCFCQNQPLKDSAATIDFISDTQAPLFFERVIRKTNHNKKATELIFKSIIATKPTSLFILGDVVSLGYSKNKWKNIDDYLAICKQNNIQVYATLGNHELMLRPKKGQINFQSRFSTFLSTGFVTVVDSVAVVLVNSNFNKMTVSEIKLQDDWYGKTILQLNNDAAIRFIIVGCHHPPFTNSKIVAPSNLVKQKFLPLFFSSKKCVLFLSGHSHNFERFNVEGKDFLVIGGGGGIHQPLQKSEKSTPDVASAYKPMFHYLSIKKVDNHLTVNSNRLKNNFSGFEKGLTFTIK